jgi:hypothetical protein
MAVIVQTSDGSGAMISKIIRNPINYFIGTFRRSLLLVFIIGSGCTGFHSDARVEEYLDENTGATITHLAEPLVFATEKVQAAYTRDYVTVGPLEINRQGQRSYQLWMNFWSTVDRIDRAHDAAGRFDVVYLMVDGEPIQLSASNRSNLAMSMTAVPYLTQSDGSFTAVYPVTRAQLTRLAQARNVELRASAGSVDLGQYRLWRAPDQSFRRFASYVSQDATQVVARE